MTKLLLIHVVFYCLSLIAVIAFDFSLTGHILACLLMAGCELFVFFSSNHSWETIKNCITKNPVVIITAGLFIVRTALTLLQCYAKQPYAQNYANLSTILSLLILYGGGLFLNSMLLNDTPLEKLFLLQAFVFGMVLLMIFPLYCVADEPVHLRTSYDLSNTMMGIPKSEEGIYMRRDDADFNMNYIGYTTEQVNEYLVELAAPLQGDDLILVTDDTKHSHTLEYTRRPVVAKGQSYQYLFSALGITIGRFLGLGTIPMYLMGRFFNLLFYIIVLYYCIKILPIGKQLLYSIALLPMPLHLAASASRDVFRITCPILIITLTLYLLYDGALSDKRKKILTVLLVILCLLQFPLRKHVYALISLFPAIVYIYKKEIISHKAIFRIFFGICSVILLFSIFKGFVFRGALITEPLHLVARSGNPGYTKEFFFNHPLTLVRLFKDTLLQYGYFYIESMIGSSLGWLDTTYPSIFVFLLILVLIVNSLKRSDESIEFSNAFRFSLLIMSAATILFSLTGMSITYTEMASNVIQGVQGRYFLPIALPFLLIFNNKFVIAKKSINISMICLQFLVMNYILQFLLMRLL